MFFPPVAPYAAAMSRLAVALSVSLALPAQGQEALEFPLHALLDLSQHAHLGAPAFERELAEVLPITSTQTPAPETPLDPFLWALSGSFGHGENPRPGAIFSCARYGLETRDTFAQHGLTAPETFALMGYARPQFNDAEVWPDGAVARLYCTFVWDDARVVAILPEAATRAAFAQSFDTLTTLSGPARSVATYGEEGFRLDAANGPRDSVVQVESARMTLTLGHQAFSFRSFLMGGGA